MQAFTGLLGFMNTGEERYRLVSRFKPSAKLNIKGLLGFMNTGEERYRLVSRFKPSAKLNIKGLPGFINTGEGRYIGWFQGSIPLLN